ncbi:MAG: AAA family ATPase [Magnetococcales bacterium]|nr:AAA family ATPase [Magnetococcales bacterium]
MRILQLRCKNLNSLVGEWQIDFTVPAYADGIFAITGPTGAGKSTLLDALSLALYGRTPRLDRINRKGNEIMARHSGDCLAEVTFASQKGLFRCYWYQKRAYKKAAGDLQDYQHEISDAATGVLISNRKSEVAREIERATGMDFDRFSRSMLLAQGDFAAFLQASADERAPILEQMTGAEIYSTLSQRVHQRHSSEQEQLRLLQAGLAGLPLLDEQQWQQLRDELGPLHHRNGVLLQQGQQLQQAIVWLQRLADLEQQHGRLEQHGQQLQVRLQQFQPDWQRLQRANRAHLLAGDAALLESLQTTQQQEQLQLSQLRDEIPMLEQVVRDKEQAWLQAQQHGQLQQQAGKRVRATIVQVKLLDSRLSGQQQRLAEIAASVSQLQRQGQQIIDQQQHRRRQLQQIQLDQVRLQDYLQQHDQDAALITALSGIEAKLDAWCVVQADYQRMLRQQGAARTQWRQTGQRWQQQQALHQQLAQRCDEAEQLLTQAWTTLQHHLSGRDVRDWQHELNALTRSDFAAERQQLRLGQPCPLCGALEHPMVDVAAQSAQLAAQAAQLAAHLDSIRQVEALWQQQQQLVHELQLQRHQSEKLLQQLGHDQQQAQRDHDRLEQQLTELQQRVSQSRAVAWQAVQPFGMADQDLITTAAAAVLKQLGQRQQQWQHHQRQQQQLSEQLVAIQQQLTLQQALLERIEADARTQQDDWAALAAIQEQWQQQRHDLFGVRDPDQEQQQLEQLLRDADQAQQQAQTAWQQCRTDLERHYKHVEILQQRLQQRAEIGQQRQQAFEQRLQQAGFQDEADYQSACLADAERSRLQQSWEEMQQQQSRLQGERQAIQRQLVEERAKRVTDQSLEQLQQQLDSQRHDQSRLQQQIGALEQRLSDHEQTKIRQQQQLQRLAEQQRESLRWQQLHDLIGSADGKKYRNFAQGFTFDAMIQQANRQLVRMSDRYRLVRDAQQPLELKVIDHYQAGEQRSTRNLSGGESFVVSLALALGLSHMASRNVRIDSLFLDEGFGTLDEEALDMALNTLAGLRQEGKLIGVISHVAALRDRIGTQIQVVPQSGGQSRLHGPGCRCIDRGGP